MTYLTSVLKKYIELLVNHCANSTNTTLDASAIQRVFEYLEKNFTIYKLLLNNEGFEFFRSRLYVIIAQTVTEVIGKKSQKTTNFQMVSPLIF
ncbi:TetR-like C-terminal domain-containing protein [Lacrimispora xylanisolvens]|uniref:TetR-like C-terminal domain-containing protein n=1 Tax=Lacrimispora xylanisolvens TaxID=384636 RepID=UPI002402C874